MKRAVVLIIVVLSFVFTINAYCQGVKVPSSAKEVRKQKMQLMGNEFTTTIYSSKLSFKQIADFYSKSLPEDGWQDLFSGKENKEHIGSNTPPSQLVFKKGDEMITISYLPTSTLVGETRFSLSQGKMSFSESAGEQKPATKTTEASDIPVYPNATSAPFSFDYPGNKPLSYTTSDNVEEVLQFYRNKMLLHRWILEEEVFPIQQETSPQDLEKIPQYEQLSPSAIEQMEQMGSFSMKRGHLLFKKNKRSCMVGVAEMSTPDSSEIKTIISIVYSD